MKATLTDTEKKAFLILLRNAYTDGDNRVEFILDPLYANMGINTAKGLVSSLQNKDYIKCYGGACYFDGKITADCVTISDLCFEEAMNTFVSDNYTPDRRTTRIKNILEICVFHLDGYEVEDEQNPNEYDLLYNNAVKKIILLNAEVSIINASIERMGQLFLI